MRSRHRPAAVLLALLTALGIVGLVPATAHAETPVTFSSSRMVIDEAGALGGDAARVQDAVRQLQSDTGQHLFVAYVHTIDGADGASAWAQQAVRRSNSPSNTAVLVVATDDRDGALISYDNRLGASAINAAKSAAGAQVRSGAWAQAALDAADSLRSAAGGSGTVQRQSSGAGTGGALAGTIGTVATIGVVALALIGGVFFFGRRRRSRDRQIQNTYRQDGAGTLYGDAPSIGAGPRQPADPFASLSVDELNKRAGAALIAADDGIHSSEQELAFAQAQYGEKATERFAAALEDARTHLRESFKLRQQLDDDIPDTEEQQRAWLGEIIRRSQDADAALAEQKGDFDALRSLEQQAPDALARVSTQADRAAARVAEHERALTGLRSRYADSALTTITDNIAQANERLAFVRSATEAAQKGLAPQGGDRSQAALAIRAAEQASQQADQLLDAIDRVGQDLQRADEQLRRSLGDTAQDIAEAKALADSGQNPELVGQVAAARTAVSAVEAELRAGRPDPFDLLRRVESARGTLDASLTGIRDAQSESRRARDSLQQAVMSAQARISAASDFITTRRGGVGSEARTRLAEAQRNLDQALALQASDPRAALTYAQQAGDLAEQAQRYAQDDIGDYAGWGGGRGRGYGGGGGFGGGFGGAILGGILIDSILRGGHGGGWGGGGWGGGDSWGGGDFGGGGFGGGDFGGGGFGGGDFGGGDF